MADLITHSLSYSKESISEYFLDPIFLASDIRNIVTVRTDIKNSEKLDFISSLEKITKQYQQGTSFTGSTGITLTKKTLTVVDMKAQVAQNGKAFLSQVKEIALKQGVDENDVSSTIFEQIIMEIYMNGLSRDLQRQLFFGDTVKEDVVSGVPDGSLDADYKEYNGFWTRIINDFDDSTIPSGQLIDLNSTTYVDTAGVKEVQTVSCTGTTGTATVTIGNVGYLATFDTSLTVTAAAFVTSHAATIAARFGKVVVTSSVADIIITAGVAGQDMDAATIVNVSGNLAGTVAATTANTDVSASLKTDACLIAFKAMWIAQPAVLRGMSKTDGRLIVTASLYDNYCDTIETLNGSDSAHRTLLDGIEVLSFRGIPVIVREEWDEHITNDFGDVRPHRALLTVPRNLVVGTDGISDDTKIEMWYEMKDQENVTRVEYKCGTQYLHSELIVAAY